MTKDKLSQINPKLKPALKIFADELEKHLGFIENCLGEIAGDPVMSRETNVLANRFHTIKGGASFFQLEEISSTAGRGEKLLTSAHAQQADQAVTEELESIFKNLASEAGVLRELMKSESDL